MALKRSKKLKRSHPNIEVIMATAFGETDTAITCMKEGAFGFLMKPLDFKSLVVEISKALEHRRLVLENKDYQENLEKKVEQRTKEVQLLNKNLKFNLPLITSKNSPEKNMTKRL